CCLQWAVQMDPKDTTTIAVLEARLAGYAVAQQAAEYSYSQATESWAVRGHVQIGTVTLHQLQRPFFLLNFGEGVILQVDIFQRLQPLFQAQSGQPWFPLSHLRVCQAVQHAPQRV